MSRRVSITYVILQSLAHGGREMRRMEMKTFKIEGKLLEKYHGCGSALAKIKLRFDGERRFLDELIDFDYATKTSSGDWVTQAEQTVDMTEDAAIILCYEDKNGNALAVDPEKFFDGFDKIDGGVFAVVVVNLSCHEACLG